MRILVSISIFAWNPSENIFVNNIWKEYSKWDSWGEQKVSFKKVQITSVSNENVVSTKVILTVVQNSELHVNVLQDILF